MADIENEKKRSKKPAGKSAKKTSRFPASVSPSEPEEMDENGSTTSGIPDANSWRDFITNASAALSGLTDDVEVDHSEDLEMSPASPAAEVGLENESPVNHGDLEDEPARASKQKRGKKKSSIDSIDWNIDTKDLEIKESTDDAMNADMASDAETANHFENLARKVAQSVAENSDIATDEPNDAPSALGDDSGEVIEMLSADQIGDEPETTFDMAGGEQVETSLETEGDITSADGLEDDAEAAPEFEMAAEPTFEDGAQQLDLLSDTLANLSAESAGESDTDLDKDASDDYSAAGDGEGDESNESSGLSDVEEFITNDQLISVIESLLFSTDKPVSVATVKQIFKNSNVKSKDITRAMETIMSDLAAPTRGVTLEEVNGGYQLRTKSDNADYLRRLAKVRPFRLSGPALECMAMVAYKQPITKHEIDEIRGVESGHLLRALMERGLVSFSGKSDLPGKPMTYGSTRKFLETFGLRNLRELPTLSEIDELMPEGIGEIEEKESLSDITDKMSNEILGTYSEAEDELSKINEQLLAVDTTSDFFEQEKIRERERRDNERAQDIREKIVMGDDVETKDRRWLDRHEAKLVAASLAAANPEVVAEELAEGEMSATEAGDMAQDMENVDSDLEASAGGPDGESGDESASESGDVSEADPTEGKVDFSGQLEALTDDSPVLASTDDEEELDGVDSGWMEQGSSTDEDDMEDVEDLTARPDWEDDENGDGHSH